MRNGDNYALNNIVYYGSGNLQDSDESVTLTPVVNNVNSYNFYKYYFRQDAFVDIFANALESNEEGRYTYDILDDQVYSELVFSRYNASFIYFYAQVIYSQNGNNTYSTVPTVTEVTVTRSQIVDGRPQREEKVIMLVLNDGLMFYADDFEYVDIDAGGAVSATYTVDFSNIFSIDVYGSFDMENFTYTNNYQAIYNLSLNANLRQRNSTKRYDCRIQSSLYQSVESISLATSLTQLNFSNDTLSFNIGVYTYPTTSTNKNVRVELDDREEKLSYKMREAQTKKIPIILILGDKEKDGNLISYRRHGSNKTYSVDKDMFVELLLNEIKDKKTKNQDQ